MKVGQLLCRALHLRERTVFSAPSNFICSRRLILDTSLRVPRERLLRNQSPRQGQEPAARCAGAAIWIIVCALVVPVAADNETERSELQVLQATQEVFRNAIDRVRPSLVRIETIGGSQPPAQGDRREDDDAAPRPRRRQNEWVDPTGSSFQIADGPTTGLVYSRDGLIVTSSFNFVREPQLISVTLPDGRRLAADLVARDQVRKIALLKVNADDLTPPEWVSAEQIQVGQWSIALGLGFGGDYPSVTVGIISALNRMGGYCLQTDAKLSPVNYGGPLLDVEGRVMGIAIPMAQRPGELAGIEMYDSGIGFALPKSKLDTIVADLKGGTSYYRGWLGIASDPRRPDAVIIINIADPSPMREAGALPGDAIVEIDGEPIHHFGHLTKALYLKPAGEMVDLLLEREGEPFEIRVPLVRGNELGPLPEMDEPFDPSQPFNEQEDD